MCAMSGTGSCCFYIQEIAEGARSRAEQQVGQGEETRVAGVGEDRT